MERHEAKEKKKLVAIQMEMDSVKGIYQPRDAGSADQRHCFKCVVALVAVMGLVIVTLVLGFILFCFMFLPSCKQDAPPLGGTGRDNITCELKESDEKGRYDIFTADEAATYLVYGWVELTRNEKVIFKTHFNHDYRTISEDNCVQNMLYSTCLLKVLLVSNTTISINFNSSCTGSMFHVLKL